MVTPEQLKIQKDIEALSLRWPKIPSIIFYTPRRFEGNLKYAFLDLCEKKRKYRLPIAISFLTLNVDDYFALCSEGLPVIYWSPETTKPLKALLEASVVVEDGFFVDSPPTPPLLFAALRGAIQINLWHGTPIKQIHLHLIDNLVDPDTHFAAIFKYSASIHTLCLASRNHSDLFARAFLAKRHKVTGYPRNDILKRTLARSDYINVDLKTLNVLRSFKGKKKIIMYAPTWRDGNPSWVNRTYVERLAGVVSRLNGVLIVNLHPFERENVGNLLTDIPGVILQKGHDVYPLLSITDILITDYSSIVFDFLLTDRPIVFFRPDQSLYVGQSRELIQEQSVSVQFPAAETFEDLERVLLQLSDRPEANRSRLKDWHNAFDDALSSERVGKVIMGLAGCGVLKRGFCRLKYALNHRRWSSPVKSDAPPLLYELDFSNPETTRCLELAGFSDQEDWGRWTEGSEAVIRFPEMLPAYVLVMLDASAYGPNRNAHVLFRTTSEETSVQLSGGVSIFLLGNICRGNEIQIDIPFPISPAETGESDDTRKLGLGIRRISIREYRGLIPPVVRSGQK